MLRTSLPARLRAVAVTVAISAGLLTAGAAVEAPSASAAMVTYYQHAPRGSWNDKANQVMYQVQKQKGKPYHYGSAGPSAFDCSGLVQFVYHRAVGYRLPRTAAAQYHASRHISRASLRVGDLVFVKSGGSITHVGIYAGHGYWWVAPHTGTVVKLQKIYTSSVVYGRVIH
ncbi:MAG: C40 family peptidase [Frankiaceae bacterium]|nr:C40 family peptidase [Frankiaceae bacterium]